MKCERKEFICNRPCLYVEPTKKFLRSWWICLQVYNERGPKDQSIFVKKENSHDIQSWLPC